MKQMFIVFSLSVALCVAGVMVSGCTQNKEASASASAQPVDLHNTVCPVSGDKVGDAKYTEVYDGKIYHFCCDDCPKEFKKDPQKFADKVAADPAKYGVKQGS